MLFNNLPRILAAATRDPSKCPAEDEDERVSLALEIDLAMRERAPAGWKGDQAREKQVLNALFPIMQPRPRGHARDLRDHQEPAGILMAETIQLGEIAIAVTRKDIKHVHLSVHPPSGRVTLVAPKGTRL